MSGTSWRTLGLLTFVLSFGPFAAAKASDAPTTPPVTTLDFHLFTHNAFAAEGAIESYESYVRAFVDTELDYQILTSLAAANIGGHMQFKTHLFEPLAKGVFDWETVWRLDYNVQSHYAYGVMPIVGNLCALPQWSSGRTDDEWWQAGINDEQQLQDYLDTVRFVVRRYQHLVKIWEVWNEPMYVFQWQSDNPAVDYAKALAATYAAIKEIDPAALVISGGIPLVEIPPPLAEEFHPEEMIDEMLGELSRMGKLEEAFDIWGYHGNTGGKIPEDWTDTLVQRRDVVSSYILRPSANTESHAFIAAGAKTSSERGIQDVRICLQQRARMDCQLYVSWPVMDFEWLNQWYGMFDANGEINDKYRHLKTLALALDSTVYDGVPTHDGGASIHAFRWVRGAEVILTAYDLAGASTVIFSDLPVSSVETWGPMGENAQTLAVTGGEVSVTLTNGETEGVTYLAYSTVGPPQQISLSPVMPSGVSGLHDSLIADGRSSLKLQAVIQDENGHPVTSATNAIAFSVVGGDGVLVGSNPTAAVNGVATIILQAGSTPGDIHLEASATGLASDIGVINAYVGWSDFQVRGSGKRWVDGANASEDIAPDVRVRVQERAVGLRGSLAAFQFSRDGGATWVGSDEFNGVALDTQWTATLKGAASGLSQVAASELTLQGGGKLGAANDEYHAVHGDIAGDFECRIKINDQQSANPQALAGIMVRNRMSTRSANGYVILATTPGNVAYLQWDADRDGYLDARSSVTLVQRPAYLKLIKQGKLFRGYVSTDDANWTLIDICRLDDADNQQQAGVFVAAQNPAQVCSADFDWLNVWRLGSVDLPERERDGAASLVIEARDLPFTQASDTAHQVRFSIPDMFYHRIVSPAYTVKTNPRLAANYAIWNLLR